jgi:hypothetical protein
VLLVDGGTGAPTTTRRLGQRIADRLGPDHPAALVVVTHVDADHITGVLDLLEAPGGDPPFAEVWFNGWEHLAPGVRGPVQGERLGAAIRRRRLPWNAAFDGKAVVVPADGPLPVVELPGGLRLTLLSPSPTQLAALQPVWEREVRDAGLVPGAPPRSAPAAPEVREGPLDPERLAARRFSEDASEANGSSIAFLAEHDGASVLFTGDAFAGVLAWSLRRLAAERGTRRVPVDALKLPHHGSRNNLSPELLEVLDCPGSCSRPTAGGTATRMPWPSRASSSAPPAPSCCSTTAPATPSRGRRRCSAAASATGPATLPAARAG